MGHEPIVIDLKGEEEEEDNDLAENGPFNGDGLDRLVQQTGIIRNVEQDEVGVSLHPCLIWTAWRYPVVLFRLMAGLVSEVGRSKESSFLLRNSTFPF